MIDNNTTPDVTAEEPRKDKKRPIIAFTLAALAVGGIGAAATSAAWTDNVFFSADAQAATFNLQGAIGADPSDTDWKESDNKDAIELVIPASKLANLLPGETRTIDLSILNDSTVSANLNYSYELVNEAVNGFETVPGVAFTDTTPTLAGGASDAFKLTVTTPADWDAANQGAKATIIVTVAGTATAG